MSSSDRRQAAAEAAVAADPSTPAAAGSGSQNGAPDGAEPDPWFDPGPKVLAPGDLPEPAEAADSPEPANAGGSGEAVAEPSALAEWFLPAGRAALLPDSMTVSSDEAQPGTPRAEYPAQVQTAGAPPWAGEITGSGAETPPPWETGPWPGPGGARTSPAAGPGPTGPVPAGMARPPLAGQPQASGWWSPRMVLVAGLVPLVIPGLVAGVLGVRRSKSGEPVRRASILAVAVSLAWAAVIVLLVAGSSGGSAGGCRYPAAVHQAYARVMADLSSNAPASSQAADLGLAVSRANASAAATDAGHIPVRSALFAMAGDLQQARADVIASRAVPASLRAQLAADGTALTASCQS